MFLCIANMHYFGDSFAESMGDTNVKLQSRNPAEARKSCCGYTGIPKPLKLLKRVNGSGHATSYFHQQSVQEVMWIKRVHRAWKACMP